MVENGYALMVRPWHARLWSRLGFGRPHVDRGEGEDWQGFYPGYMMTAVVAHLDWRDRLRVLVSGRVGVETLTRTDVLVQKCRSVSKTAILPPGAA